MTCRGKNSTIVNPTTSAAASMSATMRRLRAGQAARVGGEAQHKLVSVDGVDVEVDRDVRAPGGGEPVQQRARRRAEVVRAERGDAPPGDVREVMFGPCVQPGQGDPIRGDRSRQQLLHVAIPVPGQRGHRHGVKARVLAGRRAEVGVRVDPYDRQVIAVPAGEFGKRRVAYRALPRGWRSAPGASTRRPPPGRLTR
jgi:hypothetical protein